jgi:hypothetical protein
MIAGNMDAAAVPLPELASVYWRPRVDAGRLRRAGKLWTLLTTLQVVPFVGFAVLLGVAAPVTVPVGLVLLMHAWMIPELYAARGAGVVRPPRRLPLPAEPPPAEPRPAPESRRAAESRALGMLADLVDGPAYELVQSSGLVLEGGGLGIWLVGETGALLVRPGARRVHCYCVQVRDQDLPRADRVAHLLLALRCDEAGFATVANQAFVGAPWRLRRRLPGPARVGLDAAIVAAKGR